MIRLLLNDAQWERIAPLLPGKDGDPGRSGADNRLFIEGVLWLVRVGAPWRDLPEAFGKWGSVWKRYRRWALKGVFERIFAALSGDPERLKSVVVNLVENALKHSRPGDAVVAEIMDRGADVLVAVTDEGPGIAPQDLAHIFDRFYRGSQQLPGSGLGLYISRVIVEEHGGRLWAESRERGSRFCFVLPRDGNPPPAPVPSG